MDRRVRTSVGKVHPRPRGPSLLLHLFDEIQVSRPALIGRAPALETALDLGAGRRRSQNPVAVGCTRSLGPRGPGWSLPQRTQRRYFSPSSVAAGRHR